MRRNPNFRSIALRIWAGVLVAVPIGALLSGEPASAGPVPSTVASTVPVPPALVPPAGNDLVAEFGASGVQVYQCVAGAWVFQEPAANLLGWARGAATPRSAIHFRGPSWESTMDGSLVTGKAIASDPVDGAVPQLLLQATSNRGSGVFGTVSYIQRLRTSGGTAPAGTCTDGQSTGVPYRALYRFFTPAG
jgi:hypothetical protein